MREELDLASHQTGTVILSLVVVALNCIAKSSDSNSKKYLIAEVLIGCHTRCSSEQKIVITLHDRLKNL